MPASCNIHTEIQGQALINGIDVRLKSDKGVGIKLPTLRARTKFIANASALTPEIAEKYIWDQKRNGMIYEIP